MFALEFRGVSKWFGAVHANEEVSFSVSKATIHGVVGENGAGKSTALKMAYGLFSPDSGSIFVEGSPLRYASCAQAIAAGIGMVHQHFMLAGPMTALDNIVLGARDADAGPKFLPRAFQRIDRRRARMRLSEIASRYRLPVDWDAPVENLPIGIQQRVEILKLLYRDARTFILDEPTAVLTPSEVDEFFLNLRRLKAEGKTIILITHKLREVMALTDQITVMRRGKVVENLVTAKTNPTEIASLMVGRPMELEPIPVKPILPGPVVLNVHKLLKGISFEVRSREIVGIAGVEGNGQRELLASIRDPSEARRWLMPGGRVTLLGQDTVRMTPHELRMLGMGYVPEDRHAEGLLLDRPLIDCFLLGHERRHKYSNHGILKWRSIRERAEKALETFDVRPRDLQLPARNLSGGNQQKLIIAREMFDQPKLLVAAHPTRGVDVGAIEAVHARLLQARSDGAGILLVSSELSEIQALSDRIVVLYAGRVADIFERGRVDEKTIGLHMGGAGKNAH